MNPAGDHTGLTRTEVDARHASGRNNRVPREGSRSAMFIIRSNTFTLFNLILGVAFGLVLITGRWPDAAFGLVVVVNAGIGIVTEFRAKRTLDRLTILQAPTVRVRRDGAEQQIVLDDVVQVRTGDQIPADGEVLGTSGLEVDESLLTGESRPVRKRVADELLSGSAVVAGAATYRVNRVGIDGYANRVTAAAKRYSIVQSDLRDGVNTVLRYVSFAINPDLPAPGLEPTAGHGWARHDHAGQQLAGRDRGGCGGCDRHDPRGAGPAHLPQLRGCRDHPGPAEGARPGVARG